MKKPRQDRPRRKRLTSTSTGKTFDTISSKSRLQQCLDLLNAVNQMAACLLFTLATSAARNEMTHKQLRDLPALIRRKQFKEITGLNDRDLQSEVKDGRVRTFKRNKRAKYYSADAAQYL